MSDTIDKEMIMAAAVKGLMANATAKSAQKHNKKRKKRVTRGNRKTR